LASIGRGVMIDHRTITRDAALRQRLVVTKLNSIIEANETIL